ncbi:MAG: arginine--tRNA ligase, partial [Verrucomicrobiota bacterium]
YVVGAPQQLHFRQLFAAAARSGHPELDLRHISFGSILGKDRKPFKTRSGENVGLVEVLTESLERTRAFLDQREEEDEKFTLSEEEKPEVARIIGVAVVKYAELSQARMTDYVFDWDKMLSIKGNTAPYLLYSYVRPRSILRKALVDYEPPQDLVLEEDAEKTLAKKLLRFGEVVPEVLQDHRPNLLANYLYELAKNYHSFFQACPVLKAEDDAVRNSRLLLCDLTAKVLKQGLDLLGIEVTERM